ncbi:Phage anti-repressor protein [Yersinia intermedia]|uniref:ORF6N domain-containing protein n=1 Tax=Yersinia intermedia TaxID=631 RepID=UPI0005EA31D8|nr:ORF6N domain-containing protein [Yersinia intermedia]CNH63677.1 Phage anti-repressor protein [Yersinia intermedia]
MSKKTELVLVEAQNLQIIEYRGQRVLTTEQMAAGYGATVDRIRQNFNRNKSRFVEGKHYFQIEGKELDDLRVSFSDAQISSKTRSLTLWTERGAANHSKMLETDQAWDYYNDLTEFYFSRRDALPAPATIPDLSRLEILQLAIDSEQGRLAEKQRADKAIRTKGQISRKREASALGKLSAATRKCRVLEERLGESTKHATVKAVENVTHQKFEWRPLRKWCLENGFKPEMVPDPQYGSVKSWPREAWLAVHNINLSDVMGVTHG